MADDLSRAGASYQTPEVRAFVEAVHCRETEAMRYAVERTEAEGLPTIQVSAADGRLMQLLLAAVGARTVVEVGTLAGYSGLWLLAGAGPEGRLHTLEANPRHAAVARDVFRRAGVADRVTVHEGPALETLPRLAERGPFDAVFIDADKANYDRYVDWAFSVVRPGGLIACDNAYLFGYLAGRPADEAWDDAAVAAMQRAHRTLAARAVSVCIPTPDGLAVAVV